MDNTDNAVRFGVIEMSNNTDDVYLCWCNLVMVQTNNRYVISNPIHYNSFATLNYFVYPN